MRHRPVSGSLLFLCWCSPFSAATAVGVSLQVVDEEKLMPTDKSLAVFCFYAGVQPSPLLLLSVSSCRSCMKRGRHLYTSLWRVFCFSAGGHPFPLLLLSVSSCRSLVKIDQHQHTSRQPFVSLPVQFGSSWCLCARGSQYTVRPS